MINAVGVVSRADMVLIPDGSIIKTQSKTVGSEADKLKIKITSCQLGCF